MKSMTVLWTKALSSRPFFAPVLTSCLALLFTLGLWAPGREAQAWEGGPSCGGSTFPATGQEVSFGTTTMTQTGAPVNDDGLVRAGGALRYQDNGDGTITDLNTGLMWEKKINDGGLHDVDLVFPWSSPMETIWDWLAFVNAEGGVGFAGFNDWRIPNVKELQSIVDYGTSFPAVDVAFNNGAMGPCTVLTCSRTVSAGYWSSTTVDGFAASAWGVNFGFGIANGDVKSNFSFGNGGHVRAVRGGCVP